ncbi:hypothetical protein TKK_0016552 [Trichogramma kaykai]
MVRALCIKAGLIGIRVSNPQTSLTPSQVEIYNVGKIRRKSVDDSTSEESAYTAAPPFRKAARSDVPNTTPVISNTFTGGWEAPAEEEEIPL